MDRQTRSPEARSPIVDVRERVNSPALEVLSDGNPELPVPLEKGRPPVDLEVIIPAYNEEDRLPATLRGAVDYLARQPYTSSVVVVDNGSADLTADLAAFA